MITEGGRGVEEERERWGGGERGVGGEGGREGGMDEGEGEGEIKTEEKKRKGLGGEGRNDRRKR